MIAVDVERPTPFVEATSYVYLIHTYRYLLIIVLFTNGLFLMIIYNQILARQEIPYLETDNNLLTNIVSHIGA